MNAKDFWTEVYEQKLKELVYIGCFLPSVLPLISWITTHSVILYVVLVIGCWFVLNMIKVYGENSLIWEYDDMLPIFMQACFYIINIAFIIIKILMYFNPLQP